MEPSDLYGLPFDRFTPERNALAKRLRVEGQREEAARVAKLKKPTVAAWAVNQLVRTQKKEVTVLFKAGDGLQKAQAAVLSGKGDAGSLQRAVQAERAALDTLTARARGLLSSEGHELSPARLEQVTETLHAAAIDPQARDAVKDGCLERELRHVGLGGLEAGAAPVRGRRKSDAERAAKRKAAERAQAAARRELQQAERALRQAEQALRAAEREQAAARERVDGASARRDAARRTLENLP